MARRRGRNWRLYLWLGGGLAAACVGWMAYALPWEPLPVLAGVAVVALFLQMPKIAWSGIEYIKSSLTGPIDVQNWCRNNFGADDPFTESDTVYMRMLRRYTDETPDADGYLWGEGYALTSQAKQDADDFMHQRFDEIRPMFVNIDGSERRPDFNKAYNPLSLPLWLRLVLLPDLCGLNVGGVRRWRVLSAVSSASDPSGNRVLFEPLNTAPECIRWERAYPQIRALYGMEAEFLYEPETGFVRLRGVAAGASTAGKFANWVPDSVMRIGGEAEAEPVPDALPYEPLPFVPAAYPQGHLADGWLYFGEQFVDATKGGHWLAIDDLNHMLVMGTSGFGKSVFLNQMLQGVRHNLARFDQVLLVDLKGGVELFPYQRLGEQFRVVYQLEDLPALIAELVATIRGRLERMREDGVRMWPGPKTLLVIDEYAQIQLAPETTKEEKAAKLALLADLNKVSMLGRAAGVLIWAQLQKGTTDVMDSSFRANLASQVCFKVPNKLTAAGMFGSTDELMVDPVKLPKGRFVLFDASKGETYYLQSRVVMQ